MAVKLQHWQAKDFDPGQGSPDEVARDTPGWMDLDAPGDIYLALIDAGRLEHPFNGRNEAAAAWVRDREWWQRTTFEADSAAPGETLTLVFEGLDTFAEIYLDGVLLGRAANMFRLHDFDVTEALNAGGTHRLAIKFSPTAAMVEGRSLPNWKHFTDRVSASKRTLMRKAQYGWGWDWGPNLPTVGIWQPVRLERRGSARIAASNFVTVSIAGDQATVCVAAEVEGAASNLRLEAVLTDPAGRETTRAATDAASSVTLDMTVPGPQLWWTADLGDQPLYALSLRLFDGETVVHEHVRRVGLRTLVVDTSPDPDEPGSNFFRFVLNGAPIFAKGANWIPASSFVGAIPDAEYRDLLGRAVGANMNMIRIWGGGVYEPDVFYDACDELGLLVWQDFMFACAHYPEDDPAFTEEVRLEVDQQVRRLRGRVCLALWCGNNENQAMAEIENQLNKEENYLNGQMFYDRLIPDRLEALDPTTPYWPSSPFGGPTPNSMRAGDVHNWTVWHGLPPIPDDRLAGAYDHSPQGVAFTRYAEDSCSFVSEFGIQAAPPLATLKRWMAPEDLVLGAPGFAERHKDDPEKARAMMTPVTGLPQTLEDYVDFTLWTQAEGLKFGIEHYRRRKPHCSGALIWQLNDCWPCVSWSLIDHDGAAKGSLYATTRAFAPVMASFKALEGGDVELWIVNDTLSPVRGQAEIALVRLDGGEDWREALGYDVAANASVPVWRGPAPAAADAVLIVRAPDGAFPANRHLPVAIKDLPLATVAAPQVTATPDGEGALTVEIAADRYLAFVHLETERPDLRFSDNYFDLAAGERATVRVTSASGRGISPADIAVRCWNQRALAQAQA